MAHLTQVEFNTIREFIGPAATGRNKFSTYAEQAQDQQIQQILKQMADGCDQKTNTLMSLLG